MCHAPATDEPQFICAQCNGPIYFGEPIVYDGSAISHRFRTWCDYYRRQDKAFQASVGIKTVDK